MLRFRVNELRSADVKKGEKEELLAERKILANNEKIVSKSSENTSRAFTDAVKLAHDIFKQIDKEE